MRTSSNAFRGSAFATLIVVAAMCPDAAALALPPEAGYIVPVGHLIVPRFDHSATLLPDGKVLIAGGLERNHVITGTAELYDPGRGGFVRAGPMGSPRYGHTATLLPDGRVLIAGGSDGPHALASAELYDPATGRFIATGAMMTPRSGAVAIPLASGKVLIMGGDRAPDGGRQASAEIYDSSTGSFAATGSMHTPRDYFAAVRLTDNRVLVLGGASAGAYPNSTIEASAEIYDPEMARFTATGAMTVPRYKLGAVPLPDGRALAVGGSDSSDGRGEYASTEIYDPARGVFHTGGQMQNARFKLASGAVPLPNGDILIAGGSDQPEIYHLGTRTFTATAGSRISGFYFSSVTRLSDGDALIAGGYGRRPQDGAVADVWLYRSAR